MKASVSVNFIAVFLILQHPKFWFVLLSILIAFSSFAQNSRQSSADSGQIKLMSDQEIHLHEFKASRRSDSIQRVALEKQLANLKASEKQKKLELLGQIAEMQSRDSLRTARIKIRIDSLKQFIKGFPVAPFPQDTLFYVFNKVGSFTPQERAQAVSKRIKKLADELIFHPDSMKLVFTDQSIDITYHELILISITEMDALWMDSSPEELAAEYKTVISNAVVAYHRETSLKTILIKIGLALLVIAALVTIIILITKIFRWTKNKIVSQAGKLVKGVRIKDYELLNIQKQIQILSLFNSIVKGGNDPCHCLFFVTCNFRTFSLDKKLCHCSSWLLYQSFKGHADCHLGLPAQSLYDCHDRNCFQVCAQRCAIPER